MSIQSFLLPRNSTRKKIDNKNNKHHDSDSTQLISPKRRKIRSVEGKEELHKLFDKINSEPLYENEIPTQKPAETEKPTKLKESKDQCLFLTDQYLDWLYDYISDDDEDYYDHQKQDNEKSNLDLDMLSSKYLDKEQAEELKMALDNTHSKQIKDEKFHLFPKRCKLPNPTLYSENIELMDESNKKKYNHLVRYSGSSQSRKCIISSNSIYLWYQQGWDCPFSIYQWLIEIVAFEKDILVAKHAFDTLHLLWKVFPGDTPSFYKENTLDNTSSINYNRYMSLSTFTHILISYGALNLPEIENVSISSSPPSSSSATVINDKCTTDKDKNDRLPLKQLEWVLQLLTKSLKLWPKAYTEQQVQYIAYILMYIGLDQICILHRSQVQDTLDASLLVFSDDHWKDNVLQLAYRLCNDFTTVQQQLQLIKSAKSISIRSLYLRRVIAMMALELALYNDSHSSSTSSSTSSSSTSSSRFSSAPSSPFSSSSSSSPPKSMILFETLTENLKSSSFILPRINNMLKDKKSIFQQPEPDYLQLALRMNLLDYAIGSDKDEFNDAIEIVSSIVTQLQSMGRKIGGRLGVLERTMANEATQRLWNRLAYIIGPNSKTLENNEF